MENRIHKTKTAIHGVTHSSSQNRIKFREVKVNEDFNELNSKYELYKQGTPNLYSDNLATLKANTIKGNVTML